MKAYVLQSGIRNLAIISSGFFLFLWLNLISCAHVPEASSRIVAVGDVHGAFSEFTEILKHSGLIDESLQWIGGNATLVQVGDILDRGSEAKQAMDLLMALEKQAPRQGGQVIVLMGNHESLNLMGYYDTHSTPLPAFAKIWSAFADAESENRRQAAFRQYEAWQLRFPQCASATQAEWMKYHPPGALEYHKAIGPNGKYGKWLRKRPAVIQIDDTLFVHGGISPEMIRLKYDSPVKVNTRLKQETATFDRAFRDLSAEGLILPFARIEEIQCIVDHFAKDTAIADAGLQERVADIGENLPRIQAWMHLSSDGPLWFRGFATWTSEEGDPLVDQILKAWGAKRIVVGHTPSTEGKIRSRFSNRIFLLDTAMVYSQYPSTKGQPAALEMTGDTLTAIYKSGRIALEDSSLADGDGAPMLTGEPVFKQD